MAAPTTLQNDGSHERHSSPTSPAFENLPDYTNEIEEEMIRAAIEASKREVEVNFYILQFSAECT